MAPSLCSSWDWTVIITAQAADFIVVSSAPSDLRVILRHLCARRVDGPERPHQVFPDAVWARRIRVSALHMRPEDVCGFSAAHAPAPMGNLTKKLRARPPRISPEDVDDGLAMAAASCCAVRARERCDIVHVAHTPHAASHASHPRELEEVGGQGAGIAVEESHGSCLRLIAGAPDEVRHLQVLRHAVLVLVLGLATCAASAGVVVAAPRRLVHIHKVEHVLAFLLALYPAAAAAAARLRLLLPPPLVLVPVLVLVVSVTIFLRAWCSPGSRLGTPARWPSGRRIALIDLVPHA
mmetsp:Transcript_12260/g.36600  ORF Transcript_12260/g.36600 Transcript_12260/m.36600 type:complete len:294 (+) Transcript_12260:472-1353(+)